ncbi:hypothetical protein AB0L63_12685 [Nocardia sp. NPDC051990]|uniref:hypothetical protein n=1 Tax=Nocardia sp. NPDC051990 TaxID=3155285 RepID=UPI0034139549
MTVARFGTVRRAVASTLLGGAMLVLSDLVAPELVEVRVAADRDTHEPDVGRSGNSAGQRGRSSNHGQYKGRTERPCEYTPEGVCTGGR